MKPLKKAIRFFEKYGIEGADQMLFDLFLEWKKEVGPNVRLERSVYLSVCDVREFLDSAATIVKSGKGAMAGVYNLPQCDIGILDILIRDILLNNVNLKKIGRFKAAISDLKNTLKPNKDRKFP